MFIEFLSMVKRYFIIYYITYKRLQEINCTYQVRFKGGIRGQVSGIVSTSEFVRMIKTIFVQCLFSFITHECCFVRKYHLKKEVKYNKNTFSQCVSMREEIFSLGKRSVSIYSI